MITIELDPREIRTLHGAATLGAEILAPVLEGSAPEDISPDGRLVWPLESALMKLETALILAGEEL